MNIVNRLLANAFFIGVMTLVSVLFAEHFARVNALPVVPQCLTGTSILSDVPDWVINKQQYEPTYIYCGPLEDAAKTSEGIPIPAWVATRQQYDPTYVYRAILPSARPITGSN